MTQNGPWIPRVEVSQQRGNALLVAVKDTAVTGVGVDDHGAVGNALVYVLGQRGRNHAVVVAVGDEGGSRNPGQAMRLLTAPVLDGNKQGRYPLTEQGMATVLLLIELRRLVAR